MPGLSQRAYARHRGVTHRAVQKAIKTGRITTNPDGTIDPARADAQWTANTDPASATKHELDEQNEQNEQSPHGADVAGGNGGGGSARPTSRRPTPPGSPRPRNGSSELPTTGGFLASRAVREAYRARREKLAFERESGALVRVEEVRAASFAAGRRIREHLLTLADRIGPVVAGMCDGRECHRVIAEEVNRLLAEIQAQKGGEPS